MNSHDDLAVVCWRAMENSLNVLGVTVVLDYGFNLHNNRAPAGKRGARIL
jgi:predicted kinase